MESTLDESVEIAAAAFAIRNTSGIAFAILYYDYFLTLGAEIERFWKRPKLTLAAFGYYLNRFLSLLGHIPVIYEFYGTHTQSICSTLQVYHQLLAGVTQLIVGALQIYRVYALYESSRRVLYTLVSLAAVACITSAWAISQAWKLGHSAGDADRSGVRERVDQRDCDLRTSEIQGKYLAIVWGTILVCDAVIFVMTVYRVLQVQRRWPGSLFTLMVRDGALYFGVLLVCHLANILTCALAEPTYRGISVTTTNVIASSLIARLMLNLRDPKRAGAISSWPSDSTRYSSA